ncbi:Protein 5NUC, partial [Blattella germanica]
SLGNHEFDDGVKGLIPFINNATFPVLATNLDLSKEPDLRRPNLKNSTIFTIDGEKIAVIGYVTPETKFISQAEDVDFLDEVESINDEISRLKGANPDLKIFIALGHSGYEMDKKIAEHVPDIDVVIGGHTNTFLYTGKQPDSEVPEGLYPTWITQKSGRKVPVVQSYAYTKYLGQLDIEFDTNGEVTKAEGNPLLLDHNINQDPFILHELKKWERNMSDLAQQPVGQTKVLLDGTGIRCRLEECNMGNLVTDAYIDYMVNIHKLNFGKGWTNAPIAICRIVTLGDILAVMPFVNNMVLMKLKGTDIIEMLEWSVEDYSTTDRKGKFLQMSGLKVVYDLAKPNGKRVVKAMARCGDCRVPTYKKVSLTEEYSVLMPVFLANGGDGYTMIKRNFKPDNEMDTTDTDMVKQYFMKRTPVYTAVEGRITFVDHTDHTNHPSGASTISILFFFPIMTSLSILMFLL